MRILIIILSILLRVFAIACIVDLWQKKTGSSLMRIVVSILLFSVPFTGVVLYILYNLYVRRSFSSSSSYNSSYEDSDYDSYGSSYGSSSNYSSGSSSSGYDSSDYDYSNDCSDSYEYWKSFSSLQEFCDYLNTHEEYEWIDELSSIIEWNEWLDQRDYPDRICSDGSSFIMYDSDNYKYVVVFDGY